MNTRRNTDMRRFGQMLALLCLCGIPQLAGAGTAPPVPTGPLDAVNRQGGLLHDGQLGQQPAAGQVR